MQEVECGKFMNNCIKSNHSENSCRKFITIVHPIKSIHIFTDNCINVNINVPVHKINWWIRYWKIPNEPNICFLISINFVFNFTTKSIHDRRSHCTKCLWLFVEELQIPVIYLVLYLSYLLVHTSSYRRVNTTMIIIMENNK